MSQEYSIVELRKEGCSVTEIANRVGVSRNTVYDRLGKDDFSPRIPVKRPRGKILDPYRRVIEGWLDEDEGAWRKQRHTAARIWERLREEYGVECAESTVRQYVAALKRARRLDHADLGRCYLDLEWEPGQAQADFGEADFYVCGTRRRLSFFVLSFPYSNMGFAQVFASENAECVCEGLKRVFGYVGGVPPCIVFDNATGVGRRVCDAVSTAKTFAAFAAHYGFSFRFCNPAAGHEKGNVEGKVKYVRAKLFVPVPRITAVEAYNEGLLDKCTGLAKEHYLKGEPEDQLFMEDRLALSGLPQKDFEVVRYERRKADKQGKVRVDGPHLYATDPALAGREVIVGLGAFELAAYTEAGELVCRHERRYGSAPTDSTNPASQLPLLAVKAGAWANSQVRDRMGERLRAYMDGLPKGDLKAALRLLRDAAARSGFEPALEAMDAALGATGRLDAASVEMLLARGSGVAVAYDEPVDLAAYDRAISGKGA